MDLQRLKMGGINVQFFAAFIDPVYGERRGIERALEIISFFYSQCDKYSNLISLTSRVDDIIANIQSGKLSAVLSIEGGEALGGKIYMLEIYYRLGVRCITLTWNGRNSIADGVGERRSKGGLTNFGVEAVQGMNRLGMLIDVSHISERGFWDTLDVSAHPIIATHSNCASICNHPRNLSDNQIKAIAERQGVIGLTLVPQFVSENKPTLQKYLDHVDHIAHLVGTNSIGIGSDFDGVDKTVEGIKDCSMLPKITEGLLSRGYSHSDIGKILGGNMLRVFKEVVG